MRIIELEGAPRWRRHREIWLRALSLTLLIYQSQGEITEDNTLVSAPEHRQSLRQRDVLWYERIFVLHTSIFFPIVTPLSVAALVLAAVPTRKLWACAGRALQHCHPHQGKMSLKHSLLCNSKIQRMWHDKNRLAIPVSVVTLSINNVT